MWVVSDGDGNITTDINNNTVSGFGDSGIDVESRGGTGDVNARIANNTVSTTAATALAGVFLRSGNGTAGETSLLCVNVGSNNSTRVGRVADYYLDRFDAATTTSSSRASSPSPATPAQAETYMISTDSAPPATAFAETGSYTAATCATVSFGKRAASRSADGATAARTAPQRRASGDQPVQALGSITPVSLDTLNPGETVTLTFDVTIDASFAGSSVCNQGDVTADGGINVLTDDPDTAAPNDPTCTAVTAPADDTRPDTTLLTKPPDPSASDEATFTFTGSDDVTPTADLTYQCKLDDAAPVTCSSPYTTPVTLVDGPHTFLVRALDAARNKDATPEEWQWTVDTVRPGVSVNQASGQADPTGVSPIHFTVLFSEPVTGFGSGDVQLSGTAGATSAVATQVAPNDGTTFDVAVSGMTASGTVTASLNSGAASDAAGNPSTTSTSTDGTVTYTAVAPLGLSVAAGGVCGSGTMGTLNLALAGGPASFTVTTSNAAVVPANKVVVSGAGASPTVKITPKTAASLRSATVTVTAHRGTEAASVTITVFVGTGGADIVDGSAGSDLIVGLGGNDALGGLGANDLICAGAGNDTINGGDGDDTFKAGAGNDRMTGGIGADRFGGGAGTDKALDYNAGEGDTKTGVP